MAAMPIMIGVNGPAGIGKSWLCHQILKLLPFPGVRMVSARDSIWEEVRMEYRWRDSYQAFKDHIFPDGFSGREKMIQWAEFRRSQNRHYWLDQMVEAPTTLAASIVLNDSVAFPEEHDRFLELIPDFITIVIAPSHFRPGDLYNDNYRRCVFPLGGFRATDSSQALDIFKKNLKNATADSTNDSIWKRISLGGLVEEFEG